MPRGRPRKFNEEKALSAAMLLFWERGLSATSLDDLAEAMEMNRPSIYNAFGNKDDVYRRALDTFCGQLDRGIEHTLQDAPSFRKGLEAFFREAISLYCGSSPQMGCMMICTAPSEALSHTEIREDLHGLIERLDGVLTDRLQQAQAEGELAEDVDPTLTAALIQATLQTIALRARAGVSPSRLRKIAAYAVQRLTK